MPWSLPAVVRNRHLETRVIPVVQIAPSRQFENRTPVYFFAESETIQPTRFCPCHLSKSCDERAAIAMRRGMRAALKRKQNAVVFSATTQQCQAFAASLTKRYLGLGVRSWRRIQGPWRPRSKPCARNRRDPNDLTSACHGSGQTWRSR